MAGKKPPGKWNSYISLGATEFHPKVELISRSTITAEYNNSITCNTYMLGKIVLQTKCTYCHQK